MFKTDKCFESSIRVFERQNYLQEGTKFVLRYYSIVVIIITNRIFSWKFIT